MSVARADHCALVYTQPLCGAMPILATPCLGGQGTHLASRWGCPGAGSKPTGTVYRSHTGVVHSRRSGAGNAGGFSCAGRLARRGIAPTPMHGTLATPHRSQRRRTPGHHLQPAITATAGLGGSSRWRCQHTPHRYPHPPTQPHAPITSSPRPLLGRHHTAPTAQPHLAPLPCVPCVHRTHTAVRKDSESPLLRCCSHCSFPLGYSRRDSNPQSPP